MQKKSTVKILLVLVAVAIIGIAIYMSQPQNQQGSIRRLTNANVSQKYFTYNIANDEYPVFSVKFRANTTNAKFELLDQNGQIVKTVCQQMAMRDTFTCDWDGTAANNEDLAASGMYKFRVSFGPSYENRVDSEYFNVISEDLEAEDIEE